MFCGGRSLKKVNSKKKIIKLLRIYNSPTNYRPNVKDTFFKIYFHGIFDGGITPLHPLSWKIINLTNILKSNKIARNSQQYKNEVDFGMSGGVIKVILSTAVKLNHDVERKPLDVSTKNMTN